jgi:non-homologous end joining protein Ku
LIKAKVEGREVVTPGEQEEEPEVVNLLDALKRSVAETSHRGKSRRRKRRSA